MIRVLNILISSLKIRDDQFQGIGREFSVEPGVVEQNFIEEIIKSSRFVQMIGKLRKLAQVEP